MMDQNGDKVYTFCDSTYSPGIYEIVLQGDTAIESGVYNIEMKTWKTTAIRNNPDSVDAMIFSDRRKMVLLK